MKNTIYVLLITLLVASCGKPQKEVITRYPNEQPKLVYYVAEKNGKKERVKEEMNYESGKIRYSGEFKNEKPEGAWKYYYESGTLFAETQFNEKSPLGENWKFFDSKGKPILSNAQKIEKINLGGDHCPASLLLNQGEVQTEIQFYDNFVMRMKGEMKGNSKEGLWVYWFNNGNKQTEGTFRNGVLEGLQEVFYENGKVHYKGSYINGSRVGEWSFYDENGNLTQVQDFSSGK